MQLFLSGWGVKNYPDLNQQLFARQVKTRHLLQGGKKNKTNINKSDWTESKPDRRGFNRRTMLRPVKALGVKQTARGPKLARLAFKFGPFRKCFVKLWRWFIERIKTKGKKTDFLFYLIGREKFRRSMLFYPLFDFCMTSDPTFPGVNRKVCCADT